MTGSGTWLSDFAGLEELDGWAARRIEAAAHPVALPAGASVFAGGAPCTAYLMLTSGRVRVQQLGENGREIVLYRVTAGETCILTTACLLGGDPYPAEGITETPVRARIVGRADFDTLVARSAAFRAFVFAGYGRRVAQLMRVIDDVAFRRIDGRLARLLVERSGKHGVVSMTHQGLAMELGSAREVVSRQLKSFERARWIRLARGRIEVLNPGALRNVPGHGG